MDVDDSSAADNETSQLERVLVLLEAEANAEVAEDQAYETAKNFQLIFRALCPLLRSHLAKQPTTQLNKFEAKSAVIDERKSRTLVLKNVPESRMPLPVERAHADLATVNKLLNFIGVAVVVESSYRLPSRVENDNRPRLLCVVLPASYFVSEIMQRKKVLAKDVQFKKISVNRSMSKEQQKIEYEKRQEKRKDLGEAATRRARPSSTQETASNGGASSATSSSLSANLSPSPDLNLLLPETPVPKKCRTQSHASPSQSPKN